MGLNAWDLAPGWRRYGDALVNAIDFSTLLMQGMLSILLFAGALHVDLQALRVRASQRFAWDDAARRILAVYEAVRAKRPELRAAALTQIQEGDHARETH